MPGRGDNLGDVIRKELASLFAPLADNAPQSVPLGMAAQVTYYSLSPDCPVNYVALETPVPKVSEGLGELSPSEFAHRYPLLPAEADLASVSCAMAPVMCHAPLLEPGQAVLHGVSFESMKRCESHAVSLGQWDSNTLPVKSLSSPVPLAKTKKLEAKKPVARQNQRPVSTIKTKAWDCPPNLWGLPMSRTPIPTHRFSTQMKDRFRQTLAQKANTSTANIQIRLVFDRMNMALFQNIEQDKQGRLMCYPKSKYIGKNWATYIQEAERMPMYLVFGTVISSGQNINALVSGKGSGADLPHA